MIVRNPVFFFHSHGVVFTKRKQLFFKLRLTRIRSLSTGESSVLCAPCSVTVIDSCQ